MPFTYWLPDEQGNKKEYQTSSNAVIIVGANGTGKSKLGVWMENQIPEAVHRIGAQRDLNFNENITLRNNSQAEDFLFFGSDQDTMKRNKYYRWDHGKISTTKLLHDYDDTLSALVAKDNKDRFDYFETCKNAETIGKEKPSVPTTIIEVLQRIWDQVLPQRKLLYEDSKLYASGRNVGNIQKYSATNMSDGERAVLYLAAQVLCVPQSRVLIIDEPEIHLHKSIMNRLWKALEQSRPDCLFVYITHDTQFAAAHSHADKIWVKEFDGYNWKLEKIENESLPEELLLDILGSRKNVLFVEGERNSFDTLLYSVLYPEYLVVPCGSCTQVIARTKAFRNSSSLHECNVYGLIDRDFRSEHEIDKYKEDQIYTLNVAEVENLFVVEELIRLMAKHMGKDEDSTFANVKKYVIQDRFANQINGQICEGTVAQIKYKLMCAEISKKNEADAKASLTEAINTIDYDVIKAEQENKFQTVLRDSNYAETIKVFNKKDISRSIGHFIGINDKDYCQTVVSLMQGEKQDAILNAILPYLPIEIPR